MNPIKSPEKKTELLRCARQLFSANGYKDTSIADITRTAGVAAGTFYLYFDSKDSIFMELFFEENRQLKERILAEVDVDGDPGVVILALVQRNLQGIAANPILREWYNRDVFSRIEQRFREQGGLGQVSFLYDSFLELVQRWQAQGKLRADIDSGMIMAIFGAIINLDTHKEEIGLEYFPELQQHLTRFVLQGLAGPASQTGAGSQAGAGNQAGAGSQAGA